MSNLGVIVVTIGRNYGSLCLPMDRNKPMADWRWLEFKRAVLGALSVHDVNVIQAPKLDGEAAQHGIWEGSVEEAACFVGVPSTTFNAASLKQQLQYLAARYQQDAIGFVVGESELLS